MRSDQARRLDALGRKRARLATSQEQLSAELREAIPAARAAGISVSEIARRLGMSREAVHRHYLPR